MKLKTIRNIAIIASILVITYAVGYYAGSRNSDAGAFSRITNLSNKDVPQDKQNVDFSLFWLVWERLGKNYIDKSMLDPQKMVYGAISGMVASIGDPYTVFLNPKQQKDTKDDLGGRFEGIGAQLGVKDKKIVVVAPIKGMPAEKAGLQAEDWILKVDGEETGEWSLPEAVSKIRGPKGSSVMLTIIHKDASMSADISIQRDEIKVTSVEWELKYADCSGINQNQEKVCVEKKTSCPACIKTVLLKLTRFGDDTGSEWIKSVSEINELITSDKSIKGVILDLRNNPGGYLTGSVFIASEFLGQGVVVIQERADGSRETYTVNREGKLLKIPLVVLINKGSASASEIVAGALRDHQRAKLIGQTSFGKGSIQEAQELPNGAGIHITTAKWLMPSGKWINGSGVEPDIIVEIDTTQVSETDKQLEKAIEVLTF